MIKEFVEVESCKKSDRPQLEAALQACRLYGAKLAIAPLDRLSRDAHFLMGPMAGAWPLSARVSAKGPQLALCGAYSATPVALQLVPVSALLPAASRALPRPT